ncbi:MAG: hypothetical protein QM661_13470 [Solimonas sp.]
MRNLIPAVARRGYAVDQLRVRGHGPDLGDAHVLSSLPGVVRHLLRRARPAVLLSDKGRVNHAAVFARAGRRRHAAGAALGHDDLAAFTRLPRDLVRAVPRLEPAARRHEIEAATTDYLAAMGLPPHADA